MMFLSMLALVGCLMIAAGRLHFVFRERTEEGLDLPTRVSMVVRFGSVFVGTLLLAIALLGFVLGPAR